jgi:methionine aminotransferase
MNAKDTKGIVSSKLPNIGTTIFTTMSALANEVGALNLSQGFPNFPVDERFKAVLKQTVDASVHQYAPMPGLLRLREQIACIIEREYKRALDPDDVLITAGATQAIFTAIQALVHEGDEVIIIDPAYDCYRPAVDLVKGRAVHISLTNDLQLDLDALSNTLNSKTRMLIINNPHNPTGAVFNRNQLDALVTLLENYPTCLILSDEVYEFIQFTSEQISLNQYPQLHNRLITVSSFGKTLHVTGWKVGYLTAVGDLMREIKKVHQFLVFSVSHFAQHAIAEYLRDFQVSELAPFYHAKQHYLAEKLAGSRLKLMPCAGTYFQVVDISSITKMGDVEFAIWLTKEHGVATIPLSVFYDSQPPTNYLRLCFAKDDETLTKAAEILCQI